MEPGKLFLQHSFHLTVDVDLKFLEEAPNLLANISHFFALRVIDVNLVSKAEDFTFHRIKNVLFFVIDIIFLAPRKDSFTNAQSHKKPPSFVDPFIIIDTPK